MIRPAKANEFQILTTISFDSKGYWGYPKEYFDIWKNELTIRSEYIEKNEVFVFEDDSKIAGYYSIVEVEENIEVSESVLSRGFWLEHMFLLPSYIGKGIGAKMFAHICETCLSRGIHELRILADPNAKGFYEKMGCQYQKEFPSTIPNRTIPWLVLKVPGIDTLSAQIV